MRPAEAADPRIKTIGVALLLGTFLIYAPLNFHDFVDFDDHLFVSANPMVNSGLTGEGLAWAFGTAGPDYWRPLSWVSHMVDVELFDLDAGAHHAVSLLWHIANTLLLFLVLRWMTGRLWPSALVAALFAWHPLHVESVAWVAERKDVLCAFFWLLTMGAYAWYAAAPGWRRYGLVVLCFVLGLMSKPMIVTLPCALLLLDVWPLRRWRPAFWGEPPSGEPVRPVAGLGRLLLEKLPLLALALAVSVATYQSAHQVGAVTSTMKAPLNARVLNACGSYAAYLGKLVWPTDLIVFYPYADRGGEQTALAICLLTAISVLVVRQARARPYLLVGWLWFLGTLVPVIGLVQAGGQAIADRYTYLPLIGLFIMVAWGAEDLLRQWPHRRAGLQLAALGVLTVCLAATGRQLGHWQDSYTLGRHAHAVAPSNVAVMLLTSGMMERGRLREAAALLQDTVRRDPGDRDCQVQLGRCHLLLGNHAAARRHGAAGVRLSPQPIQVAMTLRRFTHEVERHPQNPEAHYSLGAILAAAGQTTNAILHFTEALRLKPDYADVWMDRGALHAHLGQIPRATEDYAAALRLAPTNATIQANLGALLAGQGRLDEARGHYLAALRTQPDNPVMLHNLALVFVRLGRPAEAVAAFQAAIRCQPNFPAPLDRLAWLLATSPEATQRNGPEAVRLAERANTLKDGSSAGGYDTLAAAYAEAGRFAEAVAAARRAVKLAQAAGQTRSAMEYQGRLELYETRRPYRAPPVLPPPP